MKVLVVEDNAKLAKFIVRALREETYVVDLVESGESALENLAAINYDLVVLDWMLPGMDGLAVCRKLRAKGSRVPIILLTARDAREEKVLGLDAGADDYIVKPFDLAEFLARVRALERRSRGTQDTRLTLGALIIDRAERSARLQGRALELTPRELLLLEYLVREAGRAVPRTELLEKVWETSFDPGSNVIDVHIRNLRDKLGDGAVQIETVRGVGYKIQVAT